MPTCNSAPVALPVLASAPAAGSAASYAASSDARSAGTEGGWGVGGREKALTAPTCASLACGREMVCKLVVMSGRLERGDSRVKGEG